MSGFLWRLGHASAAHPWRVLAAWLTAFLLAFGLASAYGGGTSDTYDVPGSPSEAATTAPCCPVPEEFAGLSTAALVFAPVALTLGELAAFLGDQAAADRHFAHSLRVCEAMGAERWAARTRAAASKLAAAV